MTCKRFLLSLLAMIYGFSGWATTPLPDSVLTIANAYKLNLTNLPQALNIIENMRQKRLAPEWRLDMVKGHLYSKANRYRHAVECYRKVPDAPELADSLLTRLDVLKFMMDAYDILGEEKALAEVAYRIIREAGAAGEKAYVASANFMLGKRLYEQGKTRESYRKCLEAVETMKHTSYRFRYNEMSSFYAELAVMYIKDKRFNDALRMSEKQESMVRKSHWMPYARSEQRAMYRVYAIRNWIMTEMGRMEEADRCYALSQQQNFTDVTVDHYMQTYLQRKKMYRELQALFHSSEEVIVADSNEISMTMVLILNDEAQMYYEMGDYQTAAEHYDRMVEIADSLRIRTSEQFIKSVSDAVKKEQQLARRNLQLSVIAAIVIMLILTTGFLLFYNLKVRQRNRQMSAAMQRLVYYRQMLLEKEQKPAKATATDQQTENKENDREKLLFEEADKRIIKEELFRNPDFGREELMRLMGVDKNVLATIISRYTSMNVSGYINSKRMIYAVALMKEHPEYTMNAISEACGIKSPVTFIRNFKNAFGMTPSEYRKTIEEENVI